MLQKIRTHELAKSLGRESKDVIDVLSAFSSKKKNNMSALEAPEINFVLEVISRGNMVKEFSFLAIKTTEAPEKKKKAPKAETSISEEEFLKALAELEKPQEKEEHAVVDMRTNMVDLSRFDEQERITDEIQNDVKVQKAEAFQRKQKIVKKQQRDKQEKRKFDPFEKKKEKPKREHLNLQVPPEITVGEFAHMLKRQAGEVIKELMKLGVMATVNQNIDYDTCELLASEFDATVTPEIIITAEETLFADNVPDSPENLVPRAPVVVVMGHVDHGKTKLLDTIRSANVIDTEAGGITQHIGAYRVRIGSKKITFLDTPGHEAFTAMRARGAMATDIAILVIAADDGIMPQTIEAINHAKAAGLPIIVAINKIDKEGANPDKIKQELTEHELVPEEWGGDTICVPISAKNNENIDKLLEMVALVADMKELRANPDRKAEGTIIEARLDKGKGPVATVLVQNGTLHIGDIVIAGTAVGRIRAMTNDKGKDVKSAKPSVPVEVIGFADTPEGGDAFFVVKDERLARQVAESRKHKAKVEVEQAKGQVASLEGLFGKIKEGELKELNIIVKADVQGSVEAMCQSLLKLSNDEVRVRIVHSAVGTVNDSDVMLAQASGSIIIGFNIRPNAAVADTAERAGVEIRLYRVIYQAIEEVEAAMNGMLEPTYVETVIGHAEIRQLFKVSGVGTIAGGYVTDGKIVRGAQVRLVRDGIVVYEGELSSLKRFKDDAKEVASGYECGFTLDKFNDMKESDVIEAFEMVEEK